MTPPRRGPRPTDAGGASRDDILEAARGVFATAGFQGATIKAIADAAGVDTKMVHYYFGTKRDLFSLVIKDAFHSRDLLGTIIAGLNDAPTGDADPSGSPGSPASPGSLSSPGATYVRAILTVVEDPRIGPTFLGLVRNLGVHEESRRIFLDFVTQEIIGGLAPHIRGGSPEFRVSLVGTQLLGMLMARYVLEVPAIAGADVNELADAVGPTLDRYLADEL